MPYRAFGAFGGEGLERAGRPGTSFLGVRGSVVTSSSVIHVNYHNVGRFTTYGESFKYTFLTSFFPHPSEYYTIGSDPDGSEVYGLRWLH